MSVFVLGPGEDPASDLRRFAEEVAPRVREIIDRAQRNGRADPNLSEPLPPARPAISAATPIRTTPAPRTAALDEEARPHLPRDSESPVTPTGRASQDALLQVHEHLRRELTEIREAAQSVAQGGMSPAEARSLLYRLSMSQNYWTLGAYCAQYCRLVALHHTIEDQHAFPSLGREEGALDPVLERLSWEHEVIAGVLDRLDRALVAMINDAERIEEVRRVADELNEALLSHLAYEEDELLDPLGRSNIAI